MPLIDKSAALNRQSSEMPRVTVVGAGPGGLATAILLAAEGS